MHKQLTLAAMQAAKLRGVLKAGITIVGVANSKKMHVSGDGLDTDAWRADLHTKVRQHEPSCMAREGVCGLGRLFARNNLHTAFEHRWFLQHMHGSTLGMYV